MIPFRLRDTFTRKLRDFEPLKPGEVSMYVCGVTPYDECHLGHARCYVTFDFVRRSLKRLGWKVAYVQNFTDIDDKIIKRAAERSEEPGALAERYIQSYYDVMDKLNVLRADVYPRVTGHIPQIVEFVKKLVEKGAAYALAGDVYFSVRKFPAYGRLSNRELDELISGARVDVDERKADPLDFALWKAAKPGEPAWDSPWGKGRPGWHIECSVMSTHNLKSDTFDLHGGGQDLIFPHHENEIAQAQGLTGPGTFARYWMHNGFVTINKEKMSKSLGNFFTLADIFKKFDPRVVRYFLLTQHYHSPLEFSDEGLAQAEVAFREVESALQRLAAALRSQSGNNGQDEKVLEERFARFEADFTAALADDFNSPKALAAVFELFGELNKRTATHKAVSIPSMQKGVDLVKGAFEDVFGIRFGEAAAADDADVLALIDAREKARKNRDWAEADRLRKELTAKNVVVEDTPKGARWWRKA